MQQDPGDNDTIQEFCQVNYGVSFPILGKTEVNGDKAEPVYEWMKKEIPGILGFKRVKWNFEKFLISADGKVVQRWASTAKPETLEKPILEEIKKAEGKSGQWEGRCDRLDLGTMVRLMYERGCLWAFPALRSHEILGVVDQLSTVLKTTSSCIPHESSDSVMLVKL